MIVLSAVVPKLFWMVKLGILHERGQTWKTAWKRRNMEEDKVGRGQLGRGQTRKRTNFEGDKPCVVPHVRSSCRPSTWGDIGHLSCGWWCPCLHDCRPTNDRRWCYGPSSSLCAMWSGYPTLETACVQCLQGQEQTSFGANGVWVNLGED